MSWRTISRPMRSSRSRSNPKSSSRLMAYAHMEKPVARPWKSPYFSWISTCTPARRNASATAHPPTPPPTITTFFSSAIHTPRDGRSEAAGHAAKSGAARRLSRRRHATAAGQQEARPAHDRVGEPLERARRGGREQEERGLRADGGEDPGAPQAVKGRVLPGVEQHEPADGDRDVQGHVAKVCDGQPASTRQHRALEPRLEVQPEPPLEGHDPTCVAEGGPPAAVVHHHSAAHQIDGVGAQAQRHFAPRREGGAHSTGSSADP